MYLLIVVIILILFLCAFAYYKGGDEEEDYADLVKNDMAKAREVIGDDLKVFDIFQKA